VQKPDYKQLFESFNNLNVLIIGDVMVDSYIWGQVNRISPEAPVPIVSVNKRESRLGGAANVALNVKSMGANPILCSVVGDDARGNEFIQLLNDQGMDTRGIIRSGTRITTTKFRVIGNKVQMLRVDEETDADLTGQENSELIGRIEQIIDSGGIDVIVFQDYDKGVISEGLIKTVVGKAIATGIPVAVDPKRRNFTHYRHVTLFKPNLKELKEGLNIEFNSKDRAELEKAAALLNEKLGPAILLITLSEDGVMVCYENNGTRRTAVLPSIVRSVSDVSGAGDTVIGVSSLCLARGVPPEEMAFISNLAGGQVCEKVGVVPVDREGLLNTLINLRR
jgi:rfaE bifunctional protein kinase chain/domain